MENKISDLKRRLCQVDWEDPGLLRELANSLDRINLNRVGWTVRASFNFQDEQILTLLFWNKREGRNLSISGTLASSASLENIPSLQKSRSRQETIDEAKIILEGFEKKSISWRWETTLIEQFRRSSHAAARSLATALGSITISVNNGRNFLHFKSQNILRETFKTFEEIMKSNIQIMTSRIPVSE